MRVLSWYAKQSHDRPWTVLGIHFLWILAATAIVMMTGQVALTTTNGEEWLLFDEEMVERFDALNAARLRVPGAAAEDSAELARSQKHRPASTTFVYVDEEGDNMLTPRGLQVIKQVEETYLKNSKYTDFCMLTYNGSTSLGCKPPMFSLLAPGVLLPESKWDGKEPGYPDLSDVTQDEIDERLRAILDNPMLQLQLSFFFDADFGKNCSELESPPAGCSGVNLASRMTRSNMDVVAFPLDAYVDKEGDEDESEEEMIEEAKAFLADVDQDMFDLLGMKAQLISTELVTKGSLDGVHVIWHNFYLQNRDFSSTVNADLMWAAASLMAVATYIAIHTRSLMLAALGMAQVIFSFVLAIFVTKLVFQVAYMDMMIVLIIFVTLGIGADDVFVFVDAFKQSEAVPSACGSLLSRIEYTLERATKAIFITSLTTMVAFLMTSISDLINIQAFGIFAGMNIFFLFVQTTLLMPPAVVVWERRFAWLPCCVCHPVCLCCNNRDAVLEERERRGAAMTERSQRQLEEPALTAPKQEGKMDLEADGSGSGSGDAIGALHASPSALSKRSTSFNERARADRQGLRGMEKFFNGPYMTFLVRGKYVIVVLFIALAALGGYFASQLAPPTDTEAFMPERHMMTKFNNLFSPNAAYWAGSSQEVTDEVRLVWGIQGMDKSDRAYWDPTDRGKITWDSSMDPTSVEAQEFLLSVCPTIRAGRCGEDTTGCKASRLPGEEGVRWLVRRTLEHPEGEAECWVQDMQEWLALRELALPLEPATFEEELLKYYNTHPEAREAIGYVEADDGTLVLRFLAITFTTSFQSPRSAGVTTAVMDDWEEAMEALLADAPPGMRNGFMVGEYSFVWTFTQKSLVYNAVTGLGYVFAIAFVVINLATLNLLVSTVTTATIAGIVVTVLGVGAKGISGWEFGTAESLATVILIGFSMDYCLHIAGAYIESEATDRLERTRDALTHLGVSVVAGAITTILSGLFLWGTVMIFFQKFAFLITFTVVVSFLWSVVFLPALLLIIGPEGDSCSWLSMLRPCMPGSKNKVAPAADAMPRAGPSDFAAAP